MMREAFLHAAHEMFDGYCDLYAALSRAGAQSPDVLALAEHARPGQSQPLLLLDVVHYLLRERPEHALASYYRSLRAEPLPAAEAAGPYLSFCREHRAQIEQLLPQRQVQTNEVRRAAPLLPVLGLAWQRVAEQPLALIALGASGGLLLMLDRYRYDYGPAGQVGDPAARLVLTCQARGPVPIPQRIPVLASRAGIDLNPIDVREDSQRRWLEAQIWPTEAFEDRARRLDLAAEVTAQDPPRLIQGDILTELGPLVASIPAEQAVCLMHSYTTYEMPPEARARLSSLVRQLGETRAVLCAGLEWDSHRVTWLSLQHYVPGQEPWECQLGHAQVHGEWVEWLADGKNSQTELAPVE
ncbi:DUF2332 domain-containing protein [bacterium CPR1]|nr:DUF2332 domain-containing protein [bacterium CPR1]